MELLISEQSSIVSNDPKEELRVNEPDDSDKENEYGIIGTNFMPMAAKKANTRSKG